MPQSGSEFWRGPGGGQSCARSDACAGFHFSINLNGETFAPAPPVEQQIHAKNARDGRIFCGAMARIFGPENGSAWRTNFWVQKKQNCNSAQDLCKSNFFWTTKLVHQANPLSGPKIHAIAIKKLVDGVSFWRVSAARFSERARLFLQSNYLKKTALARIRTRKNFVHPQAPSKILTRPVAPKRWPFFQINLMCFCRASQPAVGKRVTQCAETVT